MTEAQPSWMECQSTSLLGGTSQSCLECRAFEYRKCDGCPNSDFAIETFAPPEDDPMNSVTIRGWIRGISYASLMKDDRSRCFGGGEHAT
jgi:hypothetical protein